MKKLYILFLLCSFIGYSQSPGDIVITEIMQNSDAVSDTYGEYIELYNTTGSDIDINGWTLKDLETDSHVIDNGGPLNVPAGGYITLGRGGVTNPVDLEYNGGITHAYVYASFALGNSADEVVLETPGATVIDQVIYDGGPNFPDPTGASMQLDSGSLNGTSNDTGSNWCASAVAYGAGDLGSPGVANVVCPSCTTAFQTDADSAIAICDDGTVGVDTYTAYFQFQGGNVGTTFIITPTAGSVGGDDPSTMVSGSIVISGIPEGTDISVTIDDTGGGGFCNITSTTLTSPTCNELGTVNLELQGIIDFTVPSAGSDGKALHLVATGDISDLSEYGIGVANNGQNTDGQEYTFPVMAVSNGEHILLARTLAVMESYLTTAGYNLFNHVLLATSSISQNGNDAIELYKLGVRVETFGDVTVDGSGESWEYMDSWAYKNVPGAVWPTDWSYGAVNCTDGTTTIFDSTCVYPFVASLSSDDFSKTELSIYPNPVSNGIVTIKSQLSGVKSIELYDMLGRSVLNTTLNSDVLNVSSIKSGLYLLEVSIGDRSSTTKLIIK